MLKIEPPSNEFRWMMGKALLPADAPVQKPIAPAELTANSNRDQPAIPEATNEADDPFSDARPSPTESPALEEPASSQPIAPSEVSTIRESDPEARAEEKELRNQLVAIDDRFRSMIRNDPPTWDLVSLEQQYRQLEAAAAPPLRTQLKLRLDAVLRYAKLKSEYSEFSRITTETRQRDAQLLSLTNAPSGRPAVASAPLPDASESRSARPAPKSPTAFDGAGIVRRSASWIRGAPQYVLATPGGRLLAYLQPAPGVDLNPYVGQPMGVVGHRSYRQELQSELIVVRSLQPVRLKSGS
jgi:hypothetical protein